MRVWKVFDLYCTDEELEKQLNQLETEGKHIKEIISVGKSHYKIIYTVEDLIEEPTVCYTVKELIEEHTVWKH